MKIKHNIKTINCMTCEKLISGYLKNNLTIYDVDIMLNHIDDCSSCREELSIQYLVSEAFINADRSGNYDLVTSLKQKLEESEQKVERNYRRITITISILSLLFVSSVISIILLFI